MAPGRGSGTRSLLVNVASLLGRPGEQRTVRTTASFPDLRLSSAWVAPDAEVEVDLLLEAVLGGRLTVTGTVAAPWAGECRRCLGPVEGRLVADVSEVFTEAGADDADDPDLLPIEHLQVDLEPVVREAVLLALPIAPLCGEACPGPAPEATPVAVGGGDEPGARDEEVPPPRDPRWAALDALRADDPTDDPADPAEDPPPRRNPGDR